jgi:hypothetical protein
MLPFTASALTPADMTDWQIVCAESASESEAYAAQEFQTLFKGLTGTELPIVASSTPNASAIFIGPDAVQANTDLPALTSTSEETLRVSVQKNALTIDGTRPRGTLYGVYEFFEEWCGVRFLTADHTYFPEDAQAIILPLGTRTHTPTFEFRWSYYGETNRNHPFATRLRTNTLTDDAKLGGRTGFRLVGHNVAQLLPPATFGKDHPEYYALVDGERKLAMHGGGPQLCMTNPEVLDHVVEAVLNEIKQNPTALNVNVAHMDNMAFCTCDNCAALDAREESNAASTIAFVNAVAEHVTKIHPDVMIGTYAYQYTRKPPKTLTVHDNVLIQLCSIECCTLHPINDPNCTLNQAFSEDMDIWQTKAKNIFIWHYNTNFRGYLLPYPNLRSIGQNVKYYSENNGQGVFMQAAGNGFSTELSDLRNYVMSRCLWKPGRDSWTEALEFCKLHYGESAPAIIDYLRYYHDLAENAGVHPDCFPTEASLAINPDTARTIFDYFQLALATADSPEVHARVEKASMCAYRAVLSGTTMKLNYANGVCTPDLTGVNPAILDQYAALTKKYESPRETEHTPTQEYLDSLRSLFKGMEAVKIENEFWRVILIPESNAKVVEMLHKPSGRNVTNAARAFNRFRFEEWVKEGEGPMGDRIVPYTITSASPDKAVLTHTTADGSTVERTLSFSSDALRFNTQLTAGTPRAYDFQVHPEYDAATNSPDPDTLGVYVINNGKWKQANQGWENAMPTNDQLNEIREAVDGGQFAYYNHEANFGIAQRFDPKQYSALELYWGTARKQINLTMHTRSQELAKGQSAGHTYEVRYLDKPPIAKK